MVLVSIVSRHVLRMVAPLLTMAVMICPVSLSQAAPFRLAVMGDSISAGNGVSGGSPNWIGQLNPTGAFTFTNKAVGGAVSDDVVASQLPSVVTLAATNKLDGTVLMIGGNDATTRAGEALNDQQAFVDHYFNNVKTVIDSILAAKPSVKQVFVNMPDVTVTPQVLTYAAQLGLTSADVQAISHSIAAADAAANAYALSKGIPVVDLYAASHAITSAIPITLGGATFTTAFAPDKFHPAPFLQGLLANMVDKAYNLGYGLSLPILTDQKIAQNAGRTPNGLTTYFDVTPFILVPVPEVSNVTVVGASLIVMMGGFIVRRRMRSHQELSA